MTKKNSAEDNQQDDLDKPDPETLHTTDPQEHMEGPVSSLVQDVRKISKSKNPNRKKDTYKKN